MTAADKPVQPPEGRRGQPDLELEASSLGDLEAGEIRALFRQTAKVAADYLLGVEKYPVQPSLEPGQLRSRLPPSPPPTGDDWRCILDDYQSLVEPAVSHWNHPSFFGYFAISGSAPGIAAETLCAALNVNAMLWKTAPAATELEELSCDWLRQMLGLPDQFVGHINDTASISTLLALGAARQRAHPDARQQGLFMAAPLVVYASDQAHSSVDKAAMTLGLGLDGVRRVASDRNYRLDVDALAAAIEADLDAGRRPMAVVATAGTTSTTSIDPIGAIATVCARHDLWLHVDAAYGGAAAICPELRSAFEGWERADSMVINPHKWLFVPVDCSLLYVRKLDALREAFSVVPAYLASTDQATNLMDLGVQLGRRFRALKLWMVLRSFGVEGLQARLRRHCSMAQRLAEIIEREDGWQLAAPVPLSVVCFRSIVPPIDEADEFHRLLLARVNADGGQLLSSTELDGRIVLRLAIGNLRTEWRHVRAAWNCVCREAARLSAQRVVKS